MTAIDPTDLPPDPAALIQSMRAFGYSLPTALADLIDNSISAGSQAIDVELTWDGPDSTAAIVDDGCGMDEAELMQAMRLGSHRPEEQRAPTDLGRFGLGLKSAAWSQAQSLTVITRRLDGPALIARWDLDHVTHERSWSLLRTATPVADAYRERLDGSDSGTVVLLERMDRLVDDTPADDQDARERFYAAARIATQHLGMVFHRFLTGRAALRLSVNGAAIDPWDPFLESNPATQRLPEEGIDGVQIAPFVLPHFSKLGSDVHDSAAGLSGWNAHQGFYVYRARRLLVAGDWLGLRRMQQEEHFKLARIRVDLDNAMDSEWQIDVRKATARVPGRMQSEFERIARATRRRASDVYRFRGKTLARQGGAQRPLTFVWEQATRRDGVRVFRINRRHPTITTLMATDPRLRGVLERSLRLIEESLPVEAIVMESREHPDSDRGLPYEKAEAEVGALLSAAHQAMVGEGADPASALRVLATAEPFDSHPALVGAFREELGL